jgi:general secretion pathway protein G
MAQPAPRAPSSVQQRIPARRQRWRAARPGLTIIELLVVAAIIGTLAFIGIPTYSRARDNASNIRAIADISVLQKEILVYAALNGERLPDSLDDLGRGTFRDPWNNPYEYLNFDGVKGKGAMRKDRFVVPLNSTFDLYSKGKDGKSKPPLTAKESQDDIVRANDGAFIGLASEY